MLRDNGVSGLSAVEGSVSHGWGRESFKVTGCLASGVILIAPGPGRAQGPAGGVCLVNGVLQRGEVKTATSDYPFVEGRVRRLFSSPVVSADEQVIHTGPHMKLRFSTIAAQGDRLATGDVFIHEYGISLYGAEQSQPGDLCFWMSSYTDRDDHTRDVWVNAKYWLAETAGQMLASIRDR